MLEEADAERVELVHLLVVRVHHGHDHGLVKDVEVDLRAVQAVAAVILELLHGG